MQRAVVLVVVLLASVALAASATDCIKEGGQMVCTDPILKSQRVFMCDETGAFFFTEALASQCFHPATTSPGDVTAAATCYENGYFGCPEMISWPGWSSAGQTYFSGNCWTITTTMRNGFLVDQWASFSRPPVTAKDGNNQCTVPGTGISIIAWLVSDVSCPTGWSQSSLPSGDVRCWRCPDNSTWNGASCVCNPGYFKDPHTLLCVPGCTQDSDCDDHDPCNGAEHCTALGLCTASTNICDDHLTCTIDRCDKQTLTCGHEKDEDLCTCTPVLLPPLSLGVNASIGIGPVTCPVIGGEAEGEGELSGSVEVKAATCDNGCKGSGGGELEATLKGNVCGVGGQLTAKGALEKEKEYNLECGNDCQLGCGQGACETTKAKGSIGFGRDKAPKGLQKTFNGPGGIAIKCGGSYSYGLTTSLSYSGTEDKGSEETCTDCTNMEASLTGQGGASLSCKIKTPDGESGMTGAGTLTVTEEGGAKSQWGACGTESCPYVKVGVEAALKAKVAYKMMFLSVGGECSGKVKACSEANACGACSCPGCQDFSYDKFACKVNTPTIVLPTGAPR